MNPAETTYEIAIGARQGGTTSKEQIAFFYKKTMVAVKETRDWPDPSGHFERPPFVVQFTNLQVFSQPVRTGG